MSGEVQFEEDPSYSRRTIMQRQINSAQKRGASKMAEWVLKTGVVHNEQQANYLLLGVSVVFLSIALFLALNGFSTNSAPNPEDFTKPPPEIIQEYTSGRSQ